MKRCWQAALRTGGSAQARMICIKSVFHQDRQPRPPSPFNLLFAALYDLIFTKMTNMGYLIPSPSARSRKFSRRRFMAWRSTSSAPN